MKLLSTVLVGLMMISLPSCSSEKWDDKHVVLRQEPATERPVVESDSIRDEAIFSADLTLMEDDEPPFQFPCEFDFHDMGIIRVSESRWEEIQCGKGWDSRKGSCTWVYGEHIYNNFFTDSVVTEYRTHLVDLDSSQIEMTPHFLQSKLFKSHLIATTINGEGIFETVWDPNKTGKYSKPRQWGD